MIFLRINQTLSSWTAHFASWTARNWLQICLVARTSSSEYDGPTDKQENHAANNSLPHQKSSSTNAVRSVCIGKRQASPAFQSWTWIGLDHRVRLGQDFQGTLWIGSIGWDDCGPVFF